MTAITITSRRPILLLASLLIISSLACLLGHVHAAPDHHDASLCVVCAWCYLCVLTGTVSAVFLSLLAQPLSLLMPVPVHTEPGTPKRGRAPPTA